MEKPEGKYIFYKEDREHIKSRQMLPTDTLRYIEALEAIANAAFEHWKLSLHHPSSKEKAAADALYDALSVVNFMVEGE